MEQLQEHKSKWYTFGCKDATFLMTKEEFARLSFSEKILLKFHKLTCKYCRRFGEQAKKINAYLKTSASSEFLKLSPEQKRSLKEIIVQNSNDHL